MFDKLKKLAIYDPRAITAFTVFLSGPKTKIRKIFVISFNALYRLGKIAKRWKNRHDVNSIYDNDNNVKWPNISKNVQYRVAVIIAELSIPQCKMYRVDIKKNILESLGYTVYVTSWQDKIESIKYMQMADFVIFYRVPFFKNVKEYYQEADRLNIKKIYDIDDLIFDAPLYEKYLKQSKIKLNHDLKELLNGAHLYRQAIINADAFLASTKAIKAVYDEMNLKKNSYILPNGLSKEVLDIRNNKRVNPYTDKVRIFYGAGSKTHDADFDLIAHPVIQILHDYKNVELYIIGQLELSPIFDEYKEQIHCISRLSSRNYFNEISQYDIALMPLTSTFFNECKSNIKYIEASILNIPSVASNIYEFHQAITDGENGFLAPTEKEWYEKIKKLVLDAALRKRFAENAFKKCQEIYGLDKQKEIFSNILKNEISTTSFYKGMKVLQVNLYYGMTSLGGATVVVENLAKEMAELKDDKVNVAVFTTHSVDDAGIGAIRKYEYEGVEVYSCAANVNEGTSIENPVISQCFQDVMKVLRPDIVHFHAVQGFGYGLSKICKRHHIPYVMTLHDSWPFCPKLFMVNEKGEHCIENGTSVDLCETQCRFQADWIATRRNSLYDMLNSASQLYVPSFYAKKEMEKLYPAFSFLVNKNGIDEFSGKVEKTERNKIRFLFVAGEAVVKGFELIYQVLMDLLNYDWEIVLLMPSGSPKKKWPHNRARILGRQNREQMKDLYKNVDVLLFPSLGYESFGLTVREAIQSDCYVIVSECGGPAEAVVNGENGTIIPRGDAIALKKAIEKVLKNPREYIDYRTNNHGDIRSYSEQAKELIADYQKVINEDKKCN